MSLLEWAPTVITIIIFALLWMLREYIKAGIVESVRHKLNVELEAIRADLRRSEELLKADLRSKEMQIEALRGGALAALANRQNTLFNRRLEAIDQLWTGVISLRNAKGATTLISTFNFEKAVKEVARNPDLRQLIEAFAKPFDLNMIQIEDALKARPFISPMAWAIFQAYHAVVVFSLVKIHMLKAGLDVEKPLDTSDIDTLLKTALPDWAAYIDKYGSRSYHFLYDELETRIIEELGRLLDGSESDKTSVEQAAKIMNEANRVFKAATNAEGLIQQSEAQTVIKN